MVRINYAERRPVWSGLGTDVSKCNSVDEVLESSGLDFNVRQVDIKTDEYYPIGITGYKANVKDDGTPLGIVTNKYKVCQNRDAFSFLDNLVDEGLKFERAGGLQNGRKVFVLAKLPEKYIISGEAISPYIVFMNSHDGTGSIKVLMTPIRMICLNMLNLALSRATRSWSAVHAGDIEGKLEDAKNTLIYAGNYMEALGFEIEDLNNSPISDNKVIEFTSKLLPLADDMTDMQVKNVKKQRDDLLERYFHAPDLSSMRKSAYRFINAVSDFATHADPLRRRENFNESLFSRSVEGHPIVDRAYTLLKAC